MKEIKKIYFSVSLFWLFFFLAGYAGAQPGKDRKDKNKKEKSASSPDHSYEISQLYYNGTKEKILGNYDQALNYFSQCVSIDPGNHAAHYEIARIYTITGRPAEALAPIRKAVTLNPKNEWYQILLGETLVKNKLFEEAAEVYERMIKAHPNNPNYYYDLADAYLFMGKGNDAIKVYDKLENKIGVTPEISIQKQKLYLKLNKTDKAIDEIEKLIAAFPNEPRYYGILAEIYQANDMKEKALETFNKILEIDPQNPYVHLSLADYYRSAGNNQKSFEELKLAFQNPNLDVDTKLNILSSFFSLIQNFPQMEEQARTLSQLLIEAHPSDPDANALYGDLLYQDKKFREARDYYRKSVKSDNQNFKVWQQLFLVESYLNDYESMLEETEEALTLFPGQPSVYLFNGIALIQKKEYEKAIEVFNSGVKLVVDNKQMLVQFYSNLGDTYHKLKKYEASDAAYDKALEVNPKDPYVLNNYSYYLSLRGEKLEKAEKMAQMANGLEPENASFQDTYAWVLYKRKKYKDAGDWLLKALRNGGENNSVILEHYGDVMYMLGDRDKAMEYWERARRAGTGSEFLEKKIAEKKLYE